MSDATIINHHKPSSLVTKKTIVMRRWGALIMVGQTAEAMCVDWKTMRCLGRTMEPGHPAMVKFWIGRIASSSSYE